MLFDELNAQLRNAGCAILDVKKLRSDVQQLEWRQNFDPVLAKTVAKSLTLLLAQYRAGETESPV